MRGFVRGLRSLCWRAGVVTVAIGALASASSSASAEQRGSTTTGVPSSPTTVALGRDPASPPTTRHGSAPDSTGFKAPAPRPEAQGGAPEDKVRAVVPTFDTPGRSGNARIIEVDGRTGAMTQSGSTATSAAQNYQSDHVFPFDDINVDNAYNADVWVHIYERGCNDPETCSGGSRDSDGYVWFNALQVNIGTTHSNCLYGMHGGIAKGNGRSSGWFMDWSGYSGCGSTDLGNPKGNNIELQANRWYRMRVWRLDSLLLGDVPYVNWGFWIRDESTGIEKYAGAFPLAYGFMMSYATYWTEIAEPDPCRTDLWGVHSQALQYRDPTGNWGFRSASANYDATCTNTNQRRVDPPQYYTIDERETPRSTPQGAQMWP